MEKLETKNKKCPICGSEEVWPVAVYIICGATCYKITADGCSESRPLWENPACGVIVAREFLCECHDCRWREFEEFNHGFVYEYKEMAPLIYGPDEIIWRT